MSRNRKALAVLALAGVYALVKIGSTGVLPCEAPGGDPCAPTDHAIALVPADTLLYAHLDTDRDTQQSDRGRELAGRLPHSAALIRSGVATLGIPSGAKIDLQRDVEPWLGGEVALARFGRRRDIRSVLLLAVRNEGPAITFADRVGPGKARVRMIRHTRLRSYDGGFAAALAQGFLILGDERAVRDTIDVADPARDRPLALPKPKHPPLAASPDVATIRAELPANRLADVYLSRQGVQRLLTGRGGYAAQLDTFADYGATRGIAAAAIAHHDGLEVHLVSSLNRKRAKQSPSVFSALAPFEPTLAKEVSENALLYAGAGKLGEGLRSLLAQARKTSPGLAASLQRFQSRLSAKAQLDIARGVLPLLGGEGALAVEPAAEVPYVTVVADGVHEKGAGEAIAKLARPLVQAAGRRGRGVAKGFTQRKIDGVPTTSVRLSPSVNLTFAVFDGKLVVASDPAGVKEVRSGRDHLSDNSEYRRVTRYTGDLVSALIFVNLESVLRLVERAGLAANPAYATFRDDIHRLRALGVGVSGQGDSVMTKLFLTIR